MGDMADFALDQMMDDDEFACECDLDMDIEDKLDQDNVYRSSIFWLVREKPHKTCRCCGEGGLQWKQLGGKWRLFKNGTLHKCPKNPLKTTS